MKKILILFIFIFMFFLKNSTMAAYDKLIYDFTINSITGEVINFADYKNRPILIVNVASYCGFTSQYKDLQKLWEKYQKKNIIVIGVPSKSFNQEKNTNEEVKNFCKINFSIDFPLTKIYDVKGDKAHEIFKWARKNYGKTAIPKWNFHKILIDKNGKVADTFVSFTNPMSNKVIRAIDKVLK